VNENLDILIISIDDEIERKCYELKQKHIQKIMKLIFLLTCGLLLVIPLVLVFAGINILVYLLPAAIIIGIALLILLPLVLDNKLGGITE